MKQQTSKKLLSIAGNLGTFGALALFILGLVIGSRIFFVLGMVCAIIGIVIVKKTDTPHMLVLSIVFLIVNGLELFMRIRDGFEGPGWYYFILLRHPELNAWK